MTPAAAPAAPLSGTRVLRLSPSSARLASPRLAALRQPPFFAPSFRVRLSSNRIRIVSRGTKGTTIDTLTVAQARRTRARLFHLSVRGWRIGRPLRGSNR